MSDETFNVEKLLPISLEVFLRTTNVKLSQYDLKAVHINGLVDCTYSDGVQIARQFAGHVPPNAELVVEYLATISPATEKQAFYVARGIALTPNGRTVGHL